MTEEFKKLSAEQKERCKMNVFPHRLSRKGYAGLAEQMKEELCGDDELDRAIMWKKARVVKDQNTIDTKLKTTFERIDDYIRKKEDGSFKSQGWGQDVLTCALEKSEHSGRVRGVGSYITPTTFFKQPREKKKGWKQEQMVELVEARKQLSEQKDKKIKQKQLEKKKIVKNYDSLPSSLKVLCLHAVNTLKGTGHGILISLDADVFACEFEFSIHPEDIIPFCELEPISGNCILLYIWHLYGVLKSKMMTKMMTSVCQFIEPFGVSYVPKAPHEERVRALFQGLERVFRGELAIVPCNVGNHWILTIIDPHKEMVSLVDPLSHRNRDSSWKEVVNKAMTMFNAKIGRRGKKQPNWEIIKAPIQPDNKQCGFFVMRYMREIIDELADNGSISLKSHFEHRRYSQEEIDEVRIEWANCVLEHI